jgi:hypothetical protein
MAPWCGHSQARSRPPVNRRKRETCAVRHGRLLAFMKRVDSSFRHVAEPLATRTVLLLLPCMLGEGDVIEVSSLLSRSTSTPPSNLARSEMCPSPRHVARPDTGRIWHLPSRPVFGWKDPGVRCTHPLPFRVVHTSTRQTFGANRHPAKASRAWR